jgi:hypothetical protein
MMIKRRRYTPRPHSSVSMREALSDPKLLGHVLEGQSWQPWRVLLIAMMGERLILKSA